MPDDLDLETDDGDAVSITTVSARSSVTGKAMVLMTVGQADSRKTATAQLNLDEALVVGTVLVTAARRKRT